MEPIYQYSMVILHKRDYGGNAYDVPELRPPSIIERVFFDWGDFPESLRDLQQDTDAAPTDELVWEGDAVEIRFQKPEVVELYDAFALRDGKTVQPTPVLRSNLSALIDQWIQETTGKPSG